MSQGHAKPTPEPPVEKARAKLFMHGRSQAVRLPKDYRLPGSEVHVSREGSRVILEPIEETEEERRAAFEAWVERLRALGPLEGFEGDWRQQPPMPPDRKIFDD
jgi:antitoxin VapB